jgi:arsenate reductase
MAEGLLRSLGGDRYEVASAGTVATFVRPEAIRVMAELGIDISGYTSKTLDRFLGERWDLVVTVCDRARESCPVFPGARSTLHWSLDDPSEATGTEGERLAVYRRVAAEITANIRELLGTAANHTA